MAKKKCARPFGDLALLRSDPNMRLIFVDESYQKNNLGVCMVSIDAALYSKLKMTHIEILDAHNWRHKEDIEFKAAEIFSSTKGDKSVNIEERKEIAYLLMENTIAVKNARMDIFFARKKIEAKKRWEFYYEIVPLMLSESLKRKARRKEHHKNLCQIFLDGFEGKREDKERKKKFRREIASIVKKRKFTFFEDIFYVKSTIYCVGIIYADLIAYFKMQYDEGDWDDERKKEAVESFIEKLPEINIVNSENN